MEQYLASVAHKKPQIFYSTRQLQNFTNMYTRLCTRVCEKYTILQRKKKRDTSSRAHIITCDDIKMEILKHFCAKRKLLLLKLHRDSK